MPPHQSIWRNKTIELQQRFTPHRLRLPRKQRPLSIGEAYTLASQALLEQPILGLEELNENELTAMHPARDDHQQKCRNVSSGGTEPMPAVYRGPRSICWALREQTPNVQERMAAMVLDPQWSSAADFTAFVSREIDKWAKVVKAAGLKTD